MDAAALRSPETLSTYGQSVETQVRQLTRAGCKKVYREVASGTRTERARLLDLLPYLLVRHRLNAVEDLARAAWTKHA